MTLPVEKTQRMQFEALFVSAAHSEADIDATVQAAEKVFKAL